MPLSLDLAVAVLLEQSLDLVNHVCSRISLLAFQYFVLLTDRFGSHLAIARTAMLMCPGHEVIIAACNFTQILASPLIIALFTPLCTMLNRPVMNSMMAKPTRNTDHDE